MEILDSLTILYINFIDEDGEVLKLQTTKDEEISQLFGRYAHQQGIPFLLSRVVYEFRFNDQLIGLNATIESLGLAAYSMLSNVIIYVTTNLPTMKDFNERIVPNIPSYVNNHPRCFINSVASWGDQPIVIKDYLDGEPGTFILEYTIGKTKQCDTDQFITLLQDYYSNLNGFTLEINKYLGQLVSKYEFQVEELDTDQHLDKPNAIILRIIKIKQPIHRILSLVNSVTKDERWMNRLDFFSGRLRKALSSLADKKESHLSNTSLHKVKKPLFESEDVVRIKRWPNNDETLEHSWEKGTIRSYEESDDIDGYGPRRVYSVEFDNGDCRSDEDYHVIPNREIEFLNENGMDRQNGEGINHIVDKDSSDQWAREVGWYNVAVTKETRETFVHLSDALKAVASGATMFFHRPQQSMHEDYQKSVLSLRYGMLQLIDRISDPIMRRIGDILLRPAENKLYEVEQEGLIWKEAYEHYNDKQTNQMRDSIYKLALLKQCKIFAFGGSVNIDQVCRFFISSEGCLDTFLLKVPIFREGYSSTVYNKTDPEIMMAYLTNNKPDDAGDFMSIEFVDGKKSKRFTCQSDSPFKDLLTKYTTSRGLSIKSLRIKHKGKMIFLSSIGQKAPHVFSIMDNDTIEVTILQSTPSDTATNEQSKQQSSPKSKNKKKNKKHKKNNKKRTVQIAPPEDLKGEHSKLLGKIHEEAESQFKEIRQRLNAMNLERTKPKQRTSPSKAKPVEVVDNPIGDSQLGGKAGRTQFIIQVGEVSNLYKTTKPSSAGRGRRQDDIMIDLHGLNAEEAVYRLDKHLPSWAETAMKGTYPFVIPVKIVCGGGSQILAEVVENWIRQNDHVANAPKNMYS